MPPTKLRKVRGLQKVRKLVTQNPFTLNEKKEELGLALKSTETRDELSSTSIRIKFMSRCLSAPDVTYLHHCLKNKQIKLIIMLSVVRIQGFNIMHS